MGQINMAARLATLYCVWFTAKFSFKFHNNWCIRFNQWPVHRQLFHMKCDAMVWFSHWLVQWSWVQIYCLLFSIQWRIQDFPKGGTNPVGGCQGPKWQLYGKLVDLCFGGAPESANVITHWFRYLHWLVQSESFTMTNACFLRSEIYIDWLGFNSDYYTVI